jgi:hypothetical protein
MRARAKVLIAACVLGAACASQSPDFSQRFSAIEGRLDRLESPATPDASVAAPIEDASVPVELEDVYVSPIRSYSDDSGRVVLDPAAQAAEIATCKAYVPARCSEELARAQMDKQRKQKANSPRWIQRGPPVAADKTPEGRACIQRENQQCDERSQRGKVFVWLDAQLAPGKRDEKFTSEIRSRIAQELGVAPESLDVACAPQFCRLGAGVRGSQKATMLLHDEFGGGIVDRVYEYRMRRGFELEQ